MSAAKALNHCRQVYPGFEASSVEEMRDLLKALGFYWSSLHSSHYQLIAARPDVMAHRARFAPFVLPYYRSPRVLLVYGDGSFFYENAHSDCGWVNRARVGADLVPARAGLGRRINSIEFVSPLGVVKHQDG